MTDLTALSSSVGTDLALVLLHFLWQGALIAGATWIVLRIALRTKTTTRYVIVLLGGVLCALAPIATLIHLRLLPNANQLTPHVRVDMEAAHIVAASTANEVPVVSAPIPTIPLWQLGLDVAWLLGVSLMATSSRSERGAEVRW